MSPGKKYTDSARAIDSDRNYPPAEAIALAKDGAKKKFDESIDVAIRLGIDTRKADQLIRGTVSLPNGTGKTVRVAVFATGDEAKAAQDAGADVVGAEELIERVNKGFTDFDVAISTPQLMAKVGTLGRVLGPRGLMPNPKTGTVTPDVGKATQEFKAGKVEFRADKFGNVHVPIGKASFSADALTANFQVLMDEVMRAKPTSTKGKYIKSASVSSTMGPGVRIETAQ